MISYKYKLYTTKNSKHIDSMLREACFVWNHTLALQKRHYSLFKKYVDKNKMKKHFAKRVKRNLLHSQTTQEIIERVDTAYQRFFKKLAKRPPKFKRHAQFSSFKYKQGGFSINGNTICLNTIKKLFKFSKSQEYVGKIKTVTIKRTPLGEYYLILVTDANPKKYRKTHDGASVGIDFGLKTYLSMSDGTTISNPLFFKANLSEVRAKSRKLSRSKMGSNNRKKARLSLNMSHEKVSNKRNDFQWKLAHRLCKKYDYIFIEDLSLTGMTRIWGRKMSDLSHASFVEKLLQVSKKYGVTVHKIDRWYPSSKTCGCGEINKSLSLKDREWTCVQCGSVNDRDLLASKNILRKGISELESCHKTDLSAGNVCIQESPTL